MHKEAFYRGRDSSRRNNTPLSSSSEQLTLGNRSEKTLPSFLRNQTKSPDKLKTSEKHSISK